MKSNLAIIDADSIIFLVASRFKDAKVKSSALNALDDFIMDILKVSYAKEYFGFFGKKGGAKNFRYDVAKAKPYKGNRGDKADWYIYWEKIMKKHMVNIWGFTAVEYVEADDMCTMYATKYQGDPKYGKVIICSPDKDLSQVEGIWIYNYGKRTSTYLDEVKAKVNLYQQCIQGDTTDNVLGLDGCGEKAALEFGQQYDASNIKTIEADIKAYFKTYLHETLPAKQLKAAEKAYLANYKTSMGIKRYNKKTKADALRFFNVKKDMFKPAKDDYYETYYKEVHALVYMLRTIEEVNVYWKDYKETLPVKEQYIDWKLVDSERQLLDQGLEEENFEDDFDFSDDEFDDL